VNRLLPLLVVLLTSAPVVAQEARVYTNADLGRQTVTWQRTVTAEEWAGLEARQFRLPPSLPDGPTVVVVPSASWPSLETGPVPWPAEFGRPLDDGACYGCYGAPFYGGYGVPAFGHRAIRPAPGAATGAVPARAPRASGGARRR
jgi:hypothetical protein